MRRRTYVLDTSVLIFDPVSWQHFPNSDIIIPIAVLNELDVLKKGSSEAARNARVVARGLDEISQKGDISTGILLDNDILLKVDARYIDLSFPEYQGLGEPTYGDTQILACLKLNWQEHSENDVVLVSNDINLRIKAKSRGIEAEAHNDNKKDVSDLYAGMRIIIDEKAGLQLQRHGQIDPNDYGWDLSPHECVLFQAENGDGIALARKVATNKIKIVRKVYPWNVASRNAEQSFLVDLIMDKNIDLITVSGAAGTGKSLLCLAAGLELVIDRREYERLIIYRPIQSVGNEIGYTPGTTAEKLEPWFQAIMDSFEFLFGKKPNTDWRRELEMFQKKGRIEFGAITYIRGRSIPNSIILLDEAQNLGESEIKTILTRAGENTKFIITGDMSQIDAKHLDATNNGLTAVIEKFRSSELAGHITLTKGERSRLATAAAKIL